MSLFRKLFGSRSDQQKEEIKSSDRGKYMPEIKIPIDERFTINFKANGGKFLYCEDLNETFQSLQNIIEENNWEDTNALVFDENLKNNDGSLLICSNQILEKKLMELPDHFVVFATTSQIVENIGEGLRGIKSKNKQSIPSNITTIKHFKSSDEKDFLSYGSSSKNLYLLLLEDF